MDKTREVESRVAIDGAATNVTFLAVLRNNAHLLPRDCWLQAGPAVGSPRGEETRRAPQSPEESSKGGEMRGRHTYE